MIDHVSIDATELVGVIAFGLAALCCVWRGLAATADRALWWSLASVHALLAVEVLAGVRYGARNAIDAWLVALDLYGDRAAIQSALLIFVVVLVGVVGAIVLRSSRAGGDRRAALLGTGVAVVVFGVESVSLHGVDALLYAGAGPLRLIGWLWAVAAAVVIAGACVGARMQRH